jgi:hypothetical protein
MKNQLITSMKPLEIPTAYDQKIWDEKIHNISHKTLLDRISLDKDQARLLALNEKESGAWLHALPSTSLGTVLDNQFVYGLVFQRAFLTNVHVAKLSIHWAIMVYHATEVVEEEHVMK